MDVSSSNDQYNLFLRLTSMDLIIKVYTTVALSLNTCVNVLVHRDYN